MTTTFRHNASNSPGYHHPQDAYGWLEDSDDEDELIITKVSPIPRKPLPFTAASTSPPRSINLRNDNGKRTLYTNSYDPRDHQRKKMRVEYKQCEASTSGVRPRPSAQDNLIDLTDSDLTMHWSGHGRPQQRVLSPLATTFVPGSHVVRPQHRTPAPRPSSGHSSAAGSKVSAVSSWLDNVPAAAPPAPRPVPQQQAPRPVINAGRTNAPRPTGRNASGPFQIDDSSEDDADDESLPDAHEQRVQKPQPTQQTDTMQRNRIKPQVSRQIDIIRREQQLAESRKRREQASQRKKDPTAWYQARDDDLAKIKEEMRIDNFGNDSHATPTVVEHEADPRLQNRSREPSPTKDFVIDLTGAELPLIDNRLASWNFSNAKPPAPELDQADWQAKQIAEFKHRQQAEKEQQRVKQQAEIQQCKFAEEVRRTQQAAGEKRKKDAADKQRQAEYLAVIKRRKDAELQAHIQHLNEQERKNAEIRKADEVKKEAEAAAMDKMQAAYDLQQKNIADAAQRSRALVEHNRRLEAQRKIDEEKEAQAKKDEREKRRLENENFDERRKVDEQQREAARKKQAEMDKEQEGLFDRDAALARLSAVRPPQPVAKSAALDGGRGNEDVNDIVAKHTAPPGLHFKDGGDASISADAARKVKEIQEKNARGSVFQPKEPRGTREMTEKNRRIKAMAARNERMREAEEKADRKEEDDGGLVLENGGGADRGRHDSRGPSPSPPTLPKGPFSLSSAAGQALLASANAAKSHDDRSCPPPARFREGNSFRSKSRRGKHERRLGEILPEDIQLVRWRDTGMRFEDISFLWPKNVGVSRAKETLRSRYRVVKEALKASYVDGEEALLDRVMDEEAEARVELNRRVHGEWPLPGSGKGARVGGMEEEERGNAVGRSEDLRNEGRRRANERQRDARGHFLPVNKPAGGENRAAMLKSGGGARSLTTSFGSSTTEGTLPHEDVRPGGRPYVGGKRWDATTFQYYIDCMAEVAAEEAEAAEAAAAAIREDSPMSEADYVHYVYQVYRREMKQEELDQGHDLEEDEWQRTEAVFDQLTRASARAGKEALMLPDSWKNEADADCDHDYNCITLENGLKQFTVRWKGLGKVQTCVQRDVQAHGNRVTPKSKDGWAPKTVWHIREQTVVRTPIKNEKEKENDAKEEAKDKADVRKAGEGEEDDFDDLFEEEEEKVQESVEKPDEIEQEEATDDKNNLETVNDTTVNIGGAVYTSLEQANVEAIKYFISIAFEPTSGHYGHREMEIKAAEKSLADELEEADFGEDEEGPMFSRETDDGEGTTVTVWVEAGQLRGPRNL